MTQGVLRLQQSQHFSIRGRVTANSSVTKPLVTDGRRSGHYASLRTAARRIAARPASRGGSIIVIGFKHMRLRSFGLALSIAAASACGLLHVISFATAVPALLILVPFGFFAGAILCERAIQSWRRESITDRMRSSSPKGKTATIGGLYSSTLSSCSHIFTRLRVEHRASVSLLVNMSTCPRAT